MLAVLVQGGAIGLFLLLGHFWPRASVPLLGRDTVVNVVTGGLLFGLKTAVVFAVLTGLGNHPLVGLIPLDFLNLPVLQLLFAFVVGDFARYWLHRMHHEVGFFWQFHRVHHSSTQLNATSGLRMHVVDFVQLAVLPMLLFSIAFDTSHFDPLVWLVLSAIIAGMDAFQHADLRFPLTHPLAKAWDSMFNSPHFHSWHHTSEPGKHHGNYGQTLVFWDRLFGTAILEPEAAQSLGLDASQQLAQEVWGLQMLRREK